MLDSGEVICHLKNTADMLREEILSCRGWSFTGNFDDFENPLLLQFFVSRLLFGQHVLKMSKMRNQEVDKTTNVACQLLVQNTRSDRQVKYQAKTSKFERRVQAPLSIGLPLAIHSRVSDKNLNCNLSDVYIGCDYQKILDLEKRLEQGVLQRMKATGGFCLPDFVKKGVNVWFAVDTFHGTVIVINQRAEDGELINQPLDIPTTLNLLRHIP